MLTMTEYNVLNKLSFIKNHVCPPVRTIVVKWILRVLMRQVLE